MADEPRKVADGLLPAFSPDGRSIVFSDFAGNLSSDIFHMDLEGGIEPKLVFDESLADLSARISPDGRYLAYNSIISGTMGVYLRSFPGGEGKWQLSGPGGVHPRWNAGGDRLYYSQGDDLMEVEIQLGPIVNVGTPRKLFSWIAPVRRYDWASPLFDVAPDGESFVVVKATEPDAPWQSIVVVESWASEFSRTE